MSLIFYAAWNPPFVLFLLGSILVNYLVSQQITSFPEDSARRRQWLIFGILVDLGALFYFKYLARLLLSLHLAPTSRPSSYSVLLPLGISFFTFTQISYLVDLAQGEAENQDFASYLLFVSFFPHLIAGPLLHHKEMMPQFARGQRPDPDNPSDPARNSFGLLTSDVALGLTWFLLGLAKKVLIADKLAPAANAAFIHAGRLPALSAWTGLIVYSMQLYFDFSGYSDMALGLARIFSIRFPLNFDSPYKATSITDYWQRWHITLTRYITLYLYNPLLLKVQRRRLARGQKVSRKALATPLGFFTLVAYPTMITMLLTGLWHGAGVQFIVFGAIHGVYLTANQAWRHFRKSSARTSPMGLPRFAMMIGVYLQVCFALIFFRSPSLHASFAFIGDLVGIHGFGTAADLGGDLLAFSLFPVVWFFPNTQQILGQETHLSGFATSPGTPAVNPTPAPSIFSTLRWRPTLPWAVVMAVLFFAVLANLDSTASFLYFQF